MKTLASAQRTHGGNPWSLMREHGCAADQILDFSIDVNPLGMPESVRAVVLNHLPDLERYPDPEAVALRRALASFHGIPNEQVVVGNGSAELIMLVMRLRPRSKVALMAPTFTEYAWAAEQAGAAVLHHHLEEAQGFRPEFSAEAWAAMAREADMLVLCNPNNPTGVAVPNDQMRWLADQCRRHDCLLVVDEAYVELTDRPQDWTVLPPASGDESLIVLRSLTKCFAVPGLRLGYAVAAEPLVDALRALQQPWPLNSFAPAVGVELLAQHDYLARSRQALGQWRQALFQALSEMPGLTPYPTTANFIFCKLTAPAWASSQLAQHLARQGLLIRACDDFSGVEPDRFIRVAIRTQADNDRLVSALREALTHGR